MNVSVWRSTQTHLLPPQRKISIILNLTVHSSSSERLIIIHGEIEVRMLLVKREWDEKKKERRRRKKIRCKSWETLEKSEAFGWNVCMSVECAGEINCSLGQKVDRGENMKRFRRLFLKLNTKWPQLLFLTKSTESFVMFSCLINDAILVIYSV